MEFWTDLLADRFLAFVITLARVGGLVTVAPVFGGEAVPRRVRALLALAVTLLVLPLIRLPATRIAATPIDLALLIGGELLVGTSLGLGIVILFSGLLLTGQIIAQLSGTALAEVFQPGLGGSQPVVSLLLRYLALALFAIIGGHRALVAALLDTFQTIPPGAAAVDVPWVEMVTEVVHQSFVLGIRAAAPAMTALLLATLLLGLISRTLPQLNILAVGFSLTTMAMLAALSFSLGAAAWVFQEETQSMLESLAASLAPVSG